MYTTAYRVPGSLEILEAIFDPSDFVGVMQDSTTAPYRVPARFVGAPYRALAADLLAQGVVPLGLFRSAGSVGGAALPFAVMVGPRDARELVGSDFLYVIASHDWVRDHARHDWVRDHGSEVAAASAAAPNAAPTAAVAS